MHTFTYRKLSLGLLIAAVVISPSISFAKGKESPKNDPPKKPAPVMASVFPGDNSFDSSNFNSQNSTTTSSAPVTAKTSDTVSTTPEATSSPSTSDSTATTTKSSSETSSTNSNASEIIPNNPTTTSSTATDTIDNSRTTRRQQYHTATTSVEVATSTVQSSIGATGVNTTTPPGGTASISNQSELPAATDYYPPLDSLSTGATYTYSFLAMALGIMGALNILRKPREKKVWVPGLASTKTLLEP